MSSNNKLKSTKNNYRKNQCLLLLSTLKQKQYLIHLNNRPYMLLNVSTKSYRVETNRNIYFYIKIPGKKF